MTEGKKKLVIKKYKGQLPSYKLDSFERSLNDASDDMYDKLMAFPLKNKLITILMGVFLSAFAIFANILFDVISDNFNNMFIVLKIFSLIVLVFLPIAIISVNRFYINDIILGVIKIAIEVLIILCLVFTSGSTSDVIVLLVLNSFFIIDIFWCAKKSMDVNYDEVMTFMREQRDIEQNK